MKSVFTSFRGKNLAFRLDGIEPDYYTKSFGRAIQSLTAIRQFKATATKGYVGCKRRASKAAVKEWLQLHNPKQYFAEWGSDSEFFKDDVVEIYYLE